MKTDVKFKINLRIWIISLIIFIGIICISFFNSTDYVIKTSITKILKNNFDITLKNGNDIEILPNEELKDDDNISYLASFSKDNYIYNMKIDNDKKTLISFDRKPLKKIKTDKVISPEDSQKIATQFAKKLHKDKLDEVILEKNTDYNYIYRRCKNNIYINNNGIYIYIDKNSGAINYYELSWDDDIQSDTLDETTKKVKNFTSQILKNYMDLDFDDNNYALMISGFEVFQIGKKNIQIPIWEVSPMNMSNKTNKIITLGLDKNDYSLISFNASYSNYKNFHPKISEDKAKEYGMEFLKKYHPDKVDMLKLKKFSKNDDKVFRLEYVKNEDGKTFNTFKIIIGVDKESGKIDQYKIIWTE